MHQINVHRKMRERESFNFFKWWMGGKVGGKAGGTNRI